MLNVRALRPDRSRLGLEALNLANLLRTESLHRPAPRLLTRVVDVGSVPDGQVGEVVGEAVLIALADGAPPPGAVAYVQGPRLRLLPSGRSQRGSAAAGHRDATRRHTAAP